MIASAISDVAEDLGYGGTPVARFGIVYESEWGGAGAGWYIVVDRVQGWRTAWRLQVLPSDSDRMTQTRLDKLRELVAGENEKWLARGPMMQAMVVAGGPTT